jgi:pimeloyl-ACP methyl ester carboxylesterase
MQVTERWLKLSGASFRAGRSTRGVVDLKHYNAEFVECGDGPPLVIVPGLAGGIDLVEPLARELAQNFRVISYQIRGETDCFALRRRFTLADLATDLAEFVFLRGLEKPLVVGISFGGVIALACAARYPRLFTALGAQGIGVRFESGIIQRIAAMVLSNYPLPDDCSFVNQFFNLLFGYRPNVEQFDHVTRSCWQTDQSVMTHRLRLLRRLDLCDMSARVTIPSLVISGSRDVIVSSENSRALVAQLQDCHQIVIDRAGHLAPVTHAVDTSGALRQFFQSVVV